MTPPKRWVRPDSEVEPVLRAVMRYAQQQAPSAEQVARLTRRTLGARVPSRARRFEPRFAAAAALLVLFTGGAVWGAWALSRRADLRTDVTREPPRPVERAGQGRATGTMVTEPPAAPSAKVPASEARHPEPGKSGATTATSERAGAGGEVTLLQRARHAIASNPASTLQLTSEHARLYPRSQFGEEREALEIEALLRLGRRDEARARFTSFEQRHARSVYLRRMAPWFGVKGAP